MYENQHGIITLDSDMFGSQKRISTGKKSDKRLLRWYENNFDDEYRLLYESKYPPKKSDYRDITLREYGEMVLELTSDNRREYVHAGNKEMFWKIYEFEISENIPFRDMMLGDIKPTYVMRWQKECGLSPQTIVTRRAYLNIVLQTAMNDDLIPKNPVALVKLPKRVAVKSKTFYSEDEIRQIITSANGQLKNYLQIACFIGMRGSELIGLKWNNIDFEKGVIRVDSRIVSSNAMNHAFKKHLKRNGIWSGTVHDLRRSFNTMLKSKGYPTDWILDIMGHMDNRVNRNYYTGAITVDMSKIEAIVL
ncbi:MAG: tyrosine-type recombinase/integrase [Sulfuricurvum sp.]|nr:tyrosine-type recombinase/integrase [Sulfuricurvum sp.]